MDITDLKPNTLLVMTTEMHRVFKAAGCDPTCHCCENKIPVGETYKLGSVSVELAVRGNRVSAFESRKPFKTEVAHEVMLCGNIECTPEKMVAEAYRLKTERAAAARSRAGGCSVVDGKIVV